MRAEQARTRRARKPRRRRVAALALGLAVALALGALALYLSLPDVRRLAREPPRTTAFIELRRQEAQQAGRRFALRWAWRPLDRLSPYLQHAVVVSEDARFWQHEGVDWDALESAAERNWRKRRIAGGGSTITQQVAKNLFLSPSKNPVRKLRELLIARRLEAHLSKERVLEIYLNIAEWGDGVFGAEAAARRWFGHAASELTPVEAARLAVALPSPRSRAPSERTPALDRKVVRLLQAMWRDGLLEEEFYRQTVTALGGVADDRGPPPAAEPEVAPAQVPSPLPEEGQGEAADPP